MSTTSKIRAQILTKLMSLPKAMQNKFNHLYGCHDQSLSPSDVVANIEPIDLISALNLIQRSIDSLPAYNKRIEQRAIDEQLKIENDRKARELQDARELEAKLKADKKDIERRMRIEKGKALYAPGDMMAIQKQEYYDLCVASEMFRRCEAGGIDNWEWYGEAIDNPEDEAMDTFEEDLSEVLGLKNRT